LKEEVTTKVAKPRRTEWLFERFVGAAGAKPLEVERDVGVAELFEVLEEIGAEGFFQEAREVLSIYFDSGEGGMVADADVGEALVAEEFFSAFDLGEGLDGDGGAVGDAGGEAGEGGFFPVGEIQVIGEGADVGLGETGFEKRGADFPFPGGGNAGAMVAGVVEIQAV
jgi:hypothetical protein